MRLALAAALSIVAAPAAALDVAPTVHKYDGLVIAPAGDRVAAVESEGGTSHGRIVIRRAADGVVVSTIDPCAACTYSGLRFDATGRLAYLARDRAAGTVVLEIADAGVAAPRRIATIAGIAQTPRFSPDGRRIALLVTLGAAKESGAAQAGARQVGEIGEQSDEQRIAVFDLAGPPIAAAAVRALSPADRYIYEYDWTPDGRGFVVTSALGNGDDNWWVATLDAIDATTGVVRTIARPKTQLNFPRVSPDGKTVAYIGGLMSDFGSVGGDVWTVPLAGGTPTDRTPGIRASFTSLQWTTGGLRATALAGGVAQLVAIDAGGAVKPVWSGPVTLGAGDGRAAFSADGSVAAAVVQSFARAPAIQLGVLGRGLAAITHDNDAVAAPVVERSIAWRSEGHEVQGWLLAPPGADPVAKAPMITLVHGGPAAASVPTFVESGTNADLIAAGYWLFLPNPRGSYGQGAAFVEANKRDFGGGDLRDILAGIDAVEKQAPIDEARLGLSGGSYGGFMAMWANTQTTRFKAIVAAAGLSNWISYYGTNGIDQWMLPYFGKTLYEDYEAYRAPSAIYVMKQATTPTFLYVGERDIEVPPTQSIEYWHALKDLGVPTSLVIYADEGHGIRGPVGAADVQRRTVAWFDRFLRAK